MELGQIVNVNVVRAGKSRRFIGSQSKEEHRYIEKKQENNKKGVSSEEQAENQPTKCLVHFSCSMVGH